MRKLLIGLVLVVLLVVGALAYINSEAGPLIKAGVEEYGPGITGGPVTVRDVDMSLLGGTASIEDLAIGNPPGFESENAFTVSEISMRMERDIEALIGGEIHIYEIVIDGPEVTYELAGGGSNVGALQENVEDAVGVSESGSGEDDSAVTVVIDDVYIRGATLNLAISVLGDQSTSVALPDIHIEDIGREGEGVDPADAANRVMAALSGAVTQAVASDQVQGLIRSVTGSPEDIVDSVREGIGSRVRGLFGGDDD